MKHRPVCHCGDYVDMHHAGSGHSPVEMPEQDAPTMTFPEILKAKGYPFSWYIRREPRGMLIGPKGFVHPEFFELGPVTCGIGYSEQNLNEDPEGGTYYALACEGITLAAKSGLKFTFGEVENKIDKMLHYRIE